MDAAGPGVDGVVFLDDDDELIPAGVAALCGLIERLGAAAGIAAKIHVDPDGSERVRGVPEEWADRVLPGPGEVFRPLALFSTSGVVATRRAIDAGVRFDPGLWHGEDRVFLRSCAAVGPVAVSAEPAVRFLMHGAGGGNLSSARHFRTRIRDHVAVMDRYLDGASEGHFREATRWLLGAASKARVDAVSWRLLTEAAARRGWGVPVKCRVRRLLRRPVAATGTGGGA